MSIQTGFEEIVRVDVPLNEYTWMHLGGPAQYLATPKSIDQLAELIKRCREEDLPVRMLGGGSNILVRDEGVKGMVVMLSDAAFEEIKIDGNRVIAGGGAKLGHVVSSAVREGLAGLETLVGIPGTIGGALHCNAGGRGGDVGQWTTSAKVMTFNGEVLERTRDEMSFGYRESSLDELVILEGTFELEKEDPDVLTKRMQKQWIVKKAGQPLAHQSAGCVFKNPRGMSAGMLIDQSGLKGKQIGGCVVSDRHANFIVADEGASSADALALIEEVRNQVAQRLGVELETEIEIW